MIFANMSKDGRSQAALGVNLGDGAGIPSQVSKKLVENWVFPSGTTSWIVSPMPPTFLPFTKSSLKPQTPLEDFHRCLLEELAKNSNSSIMAYQK
jgi:hypothetical protein